MNGHEIKRRISGLSERFMAANRSHYSRVLTDLVDTLIKDPLCLAHHEIDIHWSILQFLLDISKDPVGGLPKDDQQLETVNNSVDVESLNDSMMDELLVSLVACNAPSGGVAKSHVPSDSELSVSFWNFRQISFILSKISLVLTKISPFISRPPKGLVRYRRSNRVEFTHRRTSTNRKSINCH